MVSISSAIEEQSVTTQEITKNMQQAARGTGEVVGTIGNVADSAQSANAASGHVRLTAEGLTAFARRLRDLIDDVLIAPAEAERRVAQA